MLRKEGRKMLLPAIRGRMKRIELFKEREEIDREKEEREEIERKRRIDFRQKERGWIEKKKNEMSRIIFRKRERGDG